jgi:hypothetical protein
MIGRFAHPGAYRDLFEWKDIPPGGPGIISPILGAIVHNVGSVIVVISSVSIAFAGDRPA